MSLAVELRGRERYADTWARQLELHAARVADEVPDTLLLVEHEHVITLGRQAQPGNVLLDEDALALAGVDLHRIERGGDVTYHGPGQLVGYPILKLAARGLSVREYVAALEGALIALAAQFGIEARRVPGLTGVWVVESIADEGVCATERKLAAIGIAVRKGVSFHGFALNVSTDLSRFNLIVPCGIVGRGVTSISAELGREVALDEVIPVAVEELQRAL